MPLYVTGLRRNVTSLSHTDMNTGLELSYVQEMQTPAVRVVHRGVTEKHFYTCLFSGRRHPKQLMSKAKPFSYFIHS